jgi:transcriptional regulator with XRE-family HTH domain
MEEKKKSIGRRIKEAAKSKNVSAQQLAAVIGKTRQAVYDIYNDRVSVNIETIIIISRELKIPLGDLIFDDPDAYYDLIPKAIPIDEVLKLVTEIHKSAKEGFGLVNLRITKSKEGIFIFDSVFKELKQILEEEEIIKFGNNVYESYLVTNPGLLKK